MKQLPFLHDAYHEIEDGINEETIFNSGDKANLSCTLQMLK